MRLMRIGRLPKPSLEPIPADGGSATYEERSRRLFDRFIYGATDSWSHHLERAGVEAWDVVRTHRRSSAAGRTSMPQPTPTGPR